jgi:hypothetical protein
MENEMKKSENKDAATFLSDYEKIINSSENSVIVQTEWSKKGDFFQKLSMYDSTYSPVKTSSYTTMINTL